VDWDNDGIIDDVGVTGDITPTYPLGTTVVTVSITGTFPRILFDGATVNDKILTVEQWDNNPWTSMQSAFFNCDNLNITALDAPNLCGVTNLSSIFYNCAKINSSLDHWDVSTITTFSGAFQQTDLFNGDISSWDVSIAGSMALMFDDAQAFNQDINGWDVGMVSIFTGMFLNFKLEVDGSVFITADPSNGH
jgi:hypothetical protein